ncbi:MAG: SDR family oxidoreductase [Ectothiorhodospiraceae bacterium]|nr:SDR family oxidoreductase [Ectothiorhodospiraceae bacterium]
MGALDGKVAWITGAGTGIGEATAMCLAEAGALVVLSGRRAEVLESVAASVRDAGGRAEVAVLDVADAEACVTAATGIAARHGRIDILFNNAGINVSARHFDVLSPADWTALVQVNLNGAFYCVHAVLPTMRAQGDGLIVHTASMAGKRHGYVSGPAYSASKHGMVSLSASINIEEGRYGIRSTVISPGEVATPILDRRPSPVSPEERARALQPEDLARTVLFVATMPPRACVNEIEITPTVNRLNATMLGER